MKKLIIPGQALGYILLLVASALIALRPETAIFHSLSLIPQAIGIFTFSILLFGVIRFIFFIIGAKKNSNQRSFHNWLEIATDFQAQKKCTFQYFYTQSRPSWHSHLPGAGKLLVATSAAAYILIFFEWIFHVTKVSFMDSMNLGQKLTIFLLSGLVIAAIGVVINLALLLVAFLLRPLRLAWLAICISIAIPAALLTSLVVLELDSFTYTIFHFGILTSSGLLRAAYGVVTMLIFLELYRRVLKIYGVISPNKPKRASSRWLSLVVLGLFTISIVLAVSHYDPSSQVADPAAGSSATERELPNIILIGGDALSATHMSLYGYERQTTPYIDALAETSLVADNAFTNASKTYGSIISIMTSKMPTQTRVIFPPDILHGIDSDQHLPGILKGLGYSTAQIGVNEYVDATTWNIHDAFDWVNQRTTKGDVLLTTLRKNGYELPAYFIFTTEGRLVNRLLQAFFIETVENPFSIVKDAPEWREDRRRIDDLLNLVEGTPGPLFVHVHLVETHGPTYEPAMRNYSIGKEQSEKWQDDYYDDSILSFDAYIHDLIDALQASGKFEQTLFILYSDHGMGFRTTVRIPLLIHFPAEEYVGRIQTNVQNMDIAPTILDYLDVPIPDWMEGDSILQFDAQVREPLFAVRLRIDEDPAEIRARAAGQDPSWFGTENHQFSVLQVFYCQRIYYLDMVAQEWEIYNAQEHTAPCARNSLLTMPQVRQVADEFLSSQGYDPAIIP